jgi:glucose/mannose-6-phosphate isomerase
MNLDNASAFSQYDPQDMLAHIDGLPDQLDQAWQHSQNLPLPDWSGIEQVLIAGMGGSAIGGELLSAYLSPICPLPVLIHRNYGLPAWAAGERTLVIASSHSGNTAETLTSFEQARSKGCRILSLATDGQLAQASREARLPLWQFEHHGQPRAAVGFSFALLLAAFYRLGLIPDPAQDLAGATEAMRTQQTHLRAELPAAHNPAKRMAGQIFGRWVVVIGADILEPVARRWKSQLNELAKAWAQFEPLPEFDHNSLAGTVNPAEELERTFALFLRAAACRPENLTRLNHSKKILMLEGFNTDFIDAQGPTALAQQWTALHLGDYVAYYLAMAYRVDPTPVEALENFKRELREISN